MASFIFTLTKKAIAGLLRALFSPLISGLLLSSTTLLCDAPFICDLLKSLPPALLSPLAMRTLQACFIISVLHRANTLLNTASQNAWRLSASPNWDFPSEIAVVTGGSSGIGLAIARALSATLDMRVAILDLQPPPPDLEDPKIHFYPCDVTSPASIASAAAALRSDLGDPSVLINNAGIGQFASILDVTEAHLRDIVNVNLLALWFTTKEFLPAMVKRDKGHVVTIASLASFVSLADSVHYAATKAGALAFHEGLVVELRGRFAAKGVVASVVHPTWVRTRMTEPYVEGLRRGGVVFITAEDVAGEVVRLVEGKRGGQVVVPGGMTYIKWLRALPGWLQTGVREVLSINRIVGTA